MNASTSPNLTQVTLVFRITTGLLAILSTLALGIPLLRSPHNQVLLAFQSCSVLFSATGLMLTFEEHFRDYWNIEAAFFFGLLLLIWSGMGLVIDNPIPLTALTIGVPVVTLFFPWDWQFELAICSVCIVSALIAASLTPDIADYHALWMIVVAESAIAVLASIQLDLQRKENDTYFRALIADEEQFRALIENAPDGLTVVDSVGNVVFQSPAAKRILGPEDFTGRNAYEFLHQDDAPQFRILLSECMRLPDLTPEMILRCRHSDGTWRTIEGVGKQLRNYGEQPLVVLNWRDVTERALHERRILESEEKFRKIFQYSINPVSVVARGDGRYIDVNEEWLRVFGYTPSEVIGKDPLELGRWADSDEYLRYAAELLAKGEIRDRAASFRTKNGSIVRGLISSVMLETNGAQIVLSVISISTVVPLPAPKE